MNAPPIQYCRTTDGVHIAYWTLGERGNPPLILVPWGMSHLGAEWEIAPFQTAYARLVRSFFLIAYDARGSGLSQRDVHDLSLANYAIDIDALANQLHLQRYALLSVSIGAMPAIVHAAGHRDAVSHLVLWTPVNGQAVRASASGRALKSAAEVDFRTWRQAMATIWTADAQVAGTQGLAEMLDRAVTAQHHEAVRNAQASWDVADELPRVAAKTLVYGVSDLRYAPLPYAQDIAATIPNAQLIIAAENIGYPQLGEFETYAKEIESLLLDDSWAVDVPPPTAAAAPAGVSPRLAATPRLTARELEVLRLIAEGASNPEIAATLVISPGTVARHVTNLLNKTDCKNRAEAARFAAEHGLLAE